MGKRDRTEDDETVTKKVKLDKKEKKEKKEKKDKKDKKEKKEKKDKKEKKEKKDKKDKKEKKTDNDSDSDSEPEKPKMTYTASANTIKSSGEYTQCDDLTNVPQSTIDNYFKEHTITIEGEQMRPTMEFSHVSLDPRMTKVLTKFPRPTPIQGVSWPYLLAGKDMVGVAETGSGKTFTFAVPAIEHVLSTSGGKGVRVLVVSPTRELAMQIYDNIKELCDVVGLHAVCVYGGVPKEQQRNDLKRASFVIATPGRLCDLIDEGSCDLSKVSYLVLDEADRMLEKGFEEAIKQIIGSTRSTGRQTVMFSATWPPEVRKLAEGFMKSPTKVMIGERDELAANKRITQSVEVIDPRAKEGRLLDLLRQYASDDFKILIFALYKKEATRVENTLTRRGYGVAAIHGDLSQQQRTKALDEFKKGEKNILLATDVAARGLDIPNVKLVINLTFPLTVEDYVHRIGRTGRAGKTGQAITLFTEHEKHLSGALINVLRGADQPVPDELLKFGGHTKKKEHGAYGAFFKDVDMTKKAKKITFD